MSILLPNFCLYEATIGVLIVNTPVEEEPWMVAIAMCKLVHARKFEIRIIFQTRLLQS